MKKIFRRSTAVILSVLTVLGCLSFSGFASDENPPEDIAFVGEFTAIDDGNSEPAEQQSEEPVKYVYDEGTVALIFLCSNDSGFPSLGHIWVYIENVTDNQVLDVGAYKLLPHEGVSVGEFGLTRSDGFGLHYNVENYTYNLYEASSNEKDNKKIQRVKYMCGEINLGTLNEISNTIKNLNWWDPIIFNCVTFACSVWNGAGLGFIFPWTVFPGITRLNIKRRVDGKTYDAKYNLDMKYFCYSEKKENTAEYSADDLNKAPAVFSPDKNENADALLYNNVWKQNGRGKSASIHVVKAGTVDTPPG